MEDSRARMGMGCKRVLERVEAATGMLNRTATKFEPAVDVENAGMLCAVPALMANGIIRRAQETLNIPNGFYGIVHILLLLGFLALARVKSMEQLRYTAPGEWGKLLGLDRIPEVKTLRRKVKHIEQSGKVAQWAGALSKDWMECDPDAAGCLYVDGHVRVYHGSQTKPPKRYVSRERITSRT